MELSFEQAEGRLRVAELTVFVDDAVLGHLPAVCVKDGVRTDDRLTLTQEVAGGSGAGLGVAEWRGCSSGRAPSAGWGCW